MGKNQLKITEDRPNDSPNVLYGPYNKMFITMEIHHGGYFKGNPKNKYINGTVSYATWVNIHTLKSHTLQQIAKGLKIQGIAKWYNLIQGESLDFGLIPMQSDLHIDRYKRRVFPDLCNKVQVFYIDQNHPTFKCYWPKAKWDGNADYLWYFFKDFIYRNWSNAKWDGNNLLQEAKDYLMSNLELDPIPYDELLESWEKAGWFVDEYYWEMTTDDEDYMEVE